MKDITYEGPPMEGVQNETIKVPVRSKGSPLIPTLRTFQADVREEVQKTTKLDMLMAERARKEAAGLPRVSEEVPEHHLGHLILLLFLVLAFGIGVGIYAIIGSSIFHSSPLIPGTKGSPAQVEIMESSASISIDQSSREQILTNISDLFAKTTLAHGDVKIIKFTTSAASGNTTVAGTTSVLLGKLGGRDIPENLPHSLDATPTYGIYFAENLVGFFKFRSRSYPETFAGMLRWEPTMGDALILTLNPKTKKSDIALLRERPFKDENIAGVPARTLSDPDGVASIAYAFLPDQKTLIIAGGRETLRALIERSRMEGK